MNRRKVVLISTIVLGLLLVGLIIQGSVLVPPSTGTWAPTPGMMAQARFGAAEVLLPDERILIAGGNGGSGGIGGCPELT